MKKITFVERQQSTTYDPVSTFFANSNKKASSVAKPNNIGSQHNKNNAVTKPTASIERPASTKMSIESTKKIEQKQKPVTNKIGRKGDHLPPRRPDPAITRQKQESIYPNAASKKNIRSTTNQPQQPPEKVPYFNIAQNDHKQELTLPNVNERRSPIKQNVNQQHSSEQTYQRGQKQPQNSATDIQVLRKRLKELQANEQEYTRKIEELEAKQQKYVKMEQKYTKLQKQHKQCGGQSKQTVKKLKQKQEELKKLLMKEEVPYNRKREVMLYNQLATLKRINRQLVTRIKNYKGTDLVQVSISQNKADVLFKEYDHSGFQSEQGDNGQYAGSQNMDMAKIENLAFTIIQNIESYMNAKSSGRQSKQLSWSEQKKLLIELTNKCKQLSLECLGIGWKIPSSNQQSINIYNEIQKYRYSMQPILSKHELNFIITEQNIELINRKNQESGATLELKQSICFNWQEPAKKFKKISEAASFYLHKYKTESQIYERASNMDNIILAHCLAQIGYVQAWLAKVTASLREGLGNLHVRLKQLEQLSGLGEAGKQALYLYVQSNIKDFVLKVPELQLELKEIGAIFRGVKPAGTKTK